MIPVIVSRKLTATIGSDKARNLAEEFALWLSGGIGPGDTFGKKSPFSAPKSVVGLLEKVHLESDDAIARWNGMIRQGITDSQAFTSDRVLVFGRAWDAPKAPYILMTILEPSHEKMKDWSMLHEVGTEFSAEIRLFAREHPSDAWIYVGY